MDKEFPALEPYLLTDAGHGERGAVIVCPGGGYGSLAEHEGRPIAEWLNSIGIHAFVLYYRVAPHRHPAPLDDLQRAIRHVRASAGKYGIRPDRIAVLGFSAGGHLVSTAGTHYEAGDLQAGDPEMRVSSRPDAMILCYPVISFIAHAHQGSVANLLGEGSDEALRRSLSNETQVDANTPPAFIWHTADDRAVPVENALLFASALSRHGVPFELHVYPHGRHGLGMAAEDDQVASWTALCATWLLKQGYAG